MSDERIGLELDLGKTIAVVEDVRRQLELYRTSVKTTADSYEVLERQVGEYEVLERRVAETTRVVVQAQAAQLDMLEQLGIRTEVATDAAGRAGRSLGRDGDFGRGVMQASFAVQDFTSVLGTQGLGRAIGSIQNNIPILATALGAGAGLAGVVSIVSIGVGLLIDNWGRLTGAWDGGETKKETERQKELAKAIEATADAAEKLARTHPREQREEESALKKAVDEFGGAAVLKELQAALVAAKGSFGAEADRKMARNFFGNLMQGDRRAWDHLRDLDLRGDVGQVLRGGPTPREVGAARDREQKRLEAEWKRREEEKKKEEERIDREKARLDAALTAQGLANERAADAARARGDAAAARRDAREVGQQQRLGREAGQRFRAQQGKPEIPSGHLPLMRPDMGPQQLQAAMLANQEEFNRNMAALQTQLRRARAIGDDQRRQNRQNRQPGMNNGW